MTRRLSIAAKAVDARKARSRQRKVGPSEIGVCRRRAGYSHHGHPVTDPDNATGLKAIAGTWYHHGALETMRREWGTVIETTVEDEVVRGHVDAIELPDDWRELAGLDPVDDAPEVVEVEDVKTRDDARAVDYVRIRGPKRSELYQAHLYASLLRRGMIGPLVGGRVKLTEAALRHAIKVKGTEGLPVETVRLRYMARTGAEDAEYPYEQPFDPDIEGEAWEWVEQVARSSSPDELPRDQDGPGLSVVCDNCPFLTACWGPAGGDVKPQAQLVVTDADLAQALAEYDRNRALEAEAKRAKDVARAKLDGTDPAIYLPEGEPTGYRLKWSGGREVPATRVPDVDRMVAILERAQVDVPMVEVPATTTPRTISVVPWTAPEPACGKPVGDPPEVEVTSGDVVQTIRQDRPRGSWTIYGPTGDEIGSMTASAAREHLADWTDPRPACILKPRHSGECAGPAAVVELEDVDPFTGQPLEPKSGPLTA